MKTKQEKVEKAARTSERPSRKMAEKVRGKEVVKTASCPVATKTGDPAVPDENTITEATADLSPADRAVVGQILSGLTAHLGSAEAARLWLVSQSPEFGTTPLSAISEGKARLVLALLESRWGPSPIYA
jgi:hypothetical protein